jgi:DNA-binding CsgD family transcriptional regulator
VQAAYVHQQHADQAAAAKPALPDSLTSRELQILALIASGLTNSEIAARLFHQPSDASRTCRGSSPSSTPGTGLS